LQSGTFIERGIALLLSLATDSSLGFPDCAPRELMPVTGTLQIIAQLQLAQCGHLSCCEKKVQWQGPIDCVAARLGELLHRHPRKKEYTRCSIEYGGKRSSAGRSVVYY
jgi:hypothetical protein